MHIRTPVAAQATPPTPGQLAFASQLTAIRFRTASGPITGLPETARALVPGERIIGQDGIGQDGRAAATTTRPAPSPSATTRGDRHLFAPVFLIPQVINAMPAPWDPRIGKYMLDNAGQQLVALHGQPDTFRPAHR